MDNDDGRIQHDSSTLIAALGLGDQAPLHAQPGQSQNQTFGGPIDDIQPIALDAPGIWPGDLSNNESVFEDDPQLLSSQPESTMEGYEIPGPFIGVPTVNTLESVNAATLGPHYQEPDYEEFFHNLDLLQDAELVGTFDPSLSHQVGFPLAGQLEPMTIFPEFPEDFGNDTHGTAAGFQGFSTLPNFFPQNSLHDVWDGVLKQWYGVPVRPLAITSC